MITTLNELKEYVVKGIVVPDRKFCAEDALAVSLCVSLTDLTTNDLNIVKTNDFNEIKTCEDQNYLLLLLHGIDTQFSDKYDIYREDWIDIAYLPYTVFGKIWKTFGREYIHNKIVKLVKDEDGLEEIIDKIFNEFDRNFVKPIDQCSYYRYKYESRESNRQFDYLNWLIEMNYENISSKSFNYIIKLFEQIITGAIIGLIDKFIK